MASAPKKSADSVVDVAPRGGTGKSQAKQGIGKKRLNLDSLTVTRTRSVAVTVDGQMLFHHIDELAPFLNNEVQGSIRQVVFMGGGEEVLERCVFQLINDTVSERFYSHDTKFHHFYHLCWADIERILDGQTFRTHILQFINLSLPSGVDEREYMRLAKHNAAQSELIQTQPDPHACAFLELPAVRDSPELRIYEKPTPVPLEVVPDFLPFPRKSLLVWLKGGDGRTLSISSDYLRCGRAVFLNELEEDFKQAKQLHSFEVKIHCPKIDSNYDEEDAEEAEWLNRRQARLFNRLGEMMEIANGDDPDSAAEIGRAHRTLFVVRTHSTGLKESKK